MNKERYSDPTADLAISNVMKEKKKKNQHTDWKEFEAERSHMEEKMERLIRKDKSVDKIRQQSVL